MRNIMLAFCCALAISSVFTLAASTKIAEPEWVNVFIHGTVGFQANFYYKTIIQAKNDCIEGSEYERNVLNIREHPYLFALQPIQKMGLHKIIPSEGMVSGAHAFATLFEEVQHAYGVHEKAQFYTFGWTGLISEKRRYAEACLLYKALRELVYEYKKRGIGLKIRPIAYSHGATLLLNLADIRKNQFPSDTFVIDEIFLVGLPVTSISHRQIDSPIFKKVYNIYSSGDKVQRLDIFSPCDFFSHREFKGDLPENLTQIEMKVTACLRRLPGRCLPQRMRGMFNQSPGHIELWFFGWAPSSYRQNLTIYPMPGAVFIPYLVDAAKKLQAKRPTAKHLLVDIRPEQEQTFVRSKCDIGCLTIPFLSHCDYHALIIKAMEFHPSNPKYKNSFIQSQTSIDVHAYK